MKRSKIRRDRGSNERAGRVSRPGQAGIGTAIVAGARMGSRRGILVALVAIAILTPGVSPRADTGDASAAYESGDFATAFREFMLEAIRQE